MKQLTTASTAGDAFALSRVAATLLTIVLEMGKMTGEVSKISHLSLHSHNQNVFLNDPMILRMQAALLRRCSPSRTPGGWSSAALRELETSEAPKAVNGHATLAPRVQIEGVCANG